MDGDGTTNMISDHGMSVLAFRHIYTTDDAPVLLHRNEVGREVAACTCSSVHCLNESGKLQMYISAFFEMRAC